MTKSGLIAEIGKLTAHCADLEKLNRELLETQSNLEHSPHGYADFFDLAPVAIVTFTRTAFIRDANLTAARMLDVERSLMIGSPFISYVAREDSRKFFLHLARCTKTGDMVATELHLRGKTGKIFEAQLVSVPLDRLMGEGTVFSSAIYDSSGRKELEKDATESRERLRSLSAHLQAVREEERTAIAREIHDELGQVLATLQLQMSLMADECRDNQHLTLKMRGMEQRITGAIRTVQRITAELRPVMLDVLGLAEAMKWQSREFQKKTGIASEITITLEERNIHRLLTTALFRIYQESLTNVLRHSGATRVEALLKGKKGGIVLLIRDNGRGINRREILDNHSFGLIGMRERAYAVGGRMKVYGAEGKGTTVIVHIPIS